MIRIERVTKRFNKILAVDSISLSIESGKSFGLVGPNGAGKSTMVNLLTGIIPPTGGLIQILGLDLEAHPTEIKKQIGVVPDGPTLFEELTAREQLTFMGKIYGLSQSEILQRSDELLTVLDLEPHASRLIRDFSHGMKKKLAFAASLLHGPKILFLDEPFEGVDPVTLKSMREILMMFKNKAGTIFLASHALDTVEKICNEVAIINNGRIVFQARTEDIQKKIKDELSQETYSSLEEIFIDVVSGDGEAKRRKKLSWL